MKLNEISDNPGAHYRAQAGRARHRLGQGQDRGPRRQGPDGAHRRRAQRLRGRPDAAARRLPKRGFNNTMFRKDFKVVNLGRLQQAIDAGKLDAEEPIDGDGLVAAGVLRRAGDGVRLLAKGELKAKLTIEVAGASQGGDRGGREGGRQGRDRRGRARSRESPRPAAGRRHGEPATSSGAGVSDEGYEWPLPPNNSPPASTSGLRQGDRAEEAPLVHPRARWSSIGSAPTSRSPASIRQVLQRGLRAQAGGILGMFDMFSGGALGRMSIFALNIMPYISASIIVQLLTAVSPHARSAQEGRRERAQEAQPVHPLRHGAAGRGPGLRHRRRARRHARGASVGGHRSRASSSGSPR